MRLSVNEVQVMCQRAAAASGVPVGLAEDCAAASAWLATAGLDGVGVFHRALERYLAGSSGPVRPGAGGCGLLPMAPGQSASALFAGPALSDRVPVRETDGGEPLCAMGVDEPLLVVACIAAAGNAPPVMTVRWQGPGGRGEARRRDGAWSILGDDAGGLAATGTADVLVARGRPEADEPSGLPCLLTAGAMARAARRCYDEGIAVPDDVYERVNARARRMLVADSPRSRIAGAGAGLRDND